MLLLLLLVLHHQYYCAAACFRCHLQKFWFAYLLAYLPLPLRGGFA